MGNMKDFEKMMLTCARYIFFGLKITTSHTMPTLKISLHFSKHKLAMARTAKCVKIACNPLPPRKHGKIICAVASAL